MTEMVLALARLADQHGESDFEYRGIRRRSRQPIEETPASPADEPMAPARSALESIYCAAGGVDNCIAELEGADSGKALVVGEPIGIEPEGGSVIGI